MVCKHIIWIVNFLLNSQFRPGSILSIVLLSGRAPIIVPFHFLHTPIAKMCFHNCFICKYCFNHHTKLWIGWCKNSCDLLQSDFGFGAKYRIAACEICKNMWNILDWKFGSKFWVWNQDDFIEEKESFYHKKIKLHHGNINDKVKCKKLFWWCSGELESDSLTKFQAVQNWRIHDHVCKGLWNHASAHGSGQSIKCAVEA